MMGPPALPQRRRAQARARKAGITDLDKVYSRDEMVTEDVIFAATGVTDGSIVQRRPPRRRVDGDRDHPHALEDRLGPPPALPPAQPLTRQCARRRPPRQARLGLPRRLDGLLAAAILVAVWTLGRRGARRRAGGGVFLAVWVGAALFGLVSAGRSLGRSPRRAAGAAAARTTAGTTGSPARPGAPPPVRPRPGCRGGRSASGRGGLATRFPGASASAARSSWSSPPAPTSSTTR